MSKEQLKLVQALATVQINNENTNAMLSSRNKVDALKSIDVVFIIVINDWRAEKLTVSCKNPFFSKKIILDDVGSSTFLDLIGASKLKEGITQVFDAFSDS